MEAALDEELAVEVVDGWDCTMVTLSGPLSLCTVPQIKVAVGKALISQGRVVVDLSGLRLEWEPGVNVFATSLEHAGGWPDARLVLFGADDELARALDRSQVTRTVPLLADRLAALQGVHRQPERVRRYLDLRPEMSAPRAARALVRQACRDWDIPIETENAAALVVSELTRNAVVHAATPLRVRVEVTDETLSISVRDLRPDLPLRLIPSTHARRLLGLHVVSTLASDWGVTDHADAQDRLGAVPTAGRAATAAKGRAADAARPMPRPLPTTDHRSAWSVHEPHLGEIDRGDLLLGGDPFQRSCQLQRKLNRHRGQARCPDLREGRVRHRPGGT
jgi:hypothetical protein